MADVGNLLGRPKDAKTFAPDPRLVMPKCRIGLEFEYEGVSDPTFKNAELNNSWEAHRDESLKENGVEFVFRNPMFGADAYNAIEALMKEAQERKFRCTLRAGIHVHVDARDMETSQLIGMIILYTILEPVIFNWIGDARENSIFCIPFYKADESLLETVSIVKSILHDEKYNARQTLAASKKFGRYAALNLNALSKYGSLEFRHMKTTHNFERVIDWINILQSLKATTEKFPTSDGAIITLAKTTPANALLSYIFGDELARKLWYPDIVKHIKELGLPTARDLVQYGLSMKEWDTLYVPDGENKGFGKFLQGLQKEEQKEVPQTTAGGLRVAARRYADLPDAPPDIPEFHPRAAFIANEINEGRPPDNVWIDINGRHWIQENADIAREANQALINVHAQGLANQLAAQVGQMNINPVGNWAVGNPEEQQLNRFIVQMGVDAAIPVALDLIGE